MFEQKSIGAAKTARAVDARVAGISSSPHDLRNPEYARLYFHLRFRNGSVINGAGGKLAGNDRNETLVIR